MRRRRRGLTKKQNNHESLCILCCLLYQGCRIDHNSFKMNPKAPKSFQNPPKSLPRPSQILPKSSSNRVQVAPKAFLRTLLDPSLKKINFECQKVVQRRPRAPRRGQNGVNFDTNFHFCSHLLFFVFLKQFGSDFLRLRT